MHRFTLSLIFLCIWTTKLISSTSSSSSSSWDYFDNRKTNGSTTTLYIIHSDIQVNKTSATSLCESFGMHLPSMENDLLDLYNAIGYWKINNVLLREEVGNIFARIMPSMDTQRAIALVNVMDGSTNEVVCSSKIKEQCHDASYKTKNLDAIIYFFIWSTMSTLLVICCCCVFKAYCMKNNNNQVSIQRKQEEEAEGNKRVRFWFA